ncbi:MAG: hypothetical protein PWQ53_822 [Bacteroidota bacterium]|nr:hypothetical protein [Bacteroidota bacterium]
MPKPGMCGSNVEDVEFFHTQNPENPHLFRNKDQSIRSR